MSSNDMIAGTSAVYGSPGKAELSSNNAETNKMVMSQVIMETGRDTVIETPPSRKKNVKESHIQGHPASSTDQLLITENEESKARL